jgi:starch synthase
VARVGGLADTVIDANEAAIAAGVATGFQLAPESAAALGHAIRRVISAHADPMVWTAIQKQGMKADVSWDRSAQKYVQLYKSLIAKGQPAE